MSLNLEPKQYHSYLIHSNGQVYRNNINVTDSLKLKAGYRILHNNEHLHRVMMRLFKYDETKYNSKRFVINHIDMNPLNNSIENLEYATYQENALSQKPKQYIDELPSDCFNIITVKQQFLNNPLIYSPSRKQYYRLYNDKYRIVEPNLTGNCHYIEFEDNHKKFRFVCDNVVGYSRPTPKKESKPTKTYYITKSGERRVYDYSVDKKTKAEDKLTTLLNYIDRNKEALRSIKTIQAKTDFINTEITKYKYSASMIYKYAHQI